MKVLELLENLNHENINYLIELDNFEKLNLEIEPLRFHLPFKARKLS